LSSSSSSAVNLTTTTKKKKKKNSLHFCLLACLLAEARNAPKETKKIPPPVDFIKRRRGTIE